MRATERNAVGHDAVAEWETCLRLLNAVEAFFREVNRGGFRLDADFPEESFQEVKGLVEDYLFPDDPEARQPYERLDTVRGEPDA